MHWLIGGWPQLGLVALKAVFMFVLAAIGLRLAERRTMAQWSIIDVVTAVAIGAIVGRTALAAQQSFVTGAIALVTLLVAHRLLSWVRMLPPFGATLDHPVRVLVQDGQVRAGELTRCGLTTGDLEAQLRQRGVFDLRDLRYVLYESRGGLTIVRHEDSDTPLVHVVCAKNARTRT